MKVYFVIIGVCCVITFITWFGDSLHTPAFWAFVVSILLFIIPLTFIKHGKIK